MAEIRVTKVQQPHTKIRNVPIAVTPEGFWCCPSHAVFQKTVKTQNSLNKTKPSSPPPPKSSFPKKQTSAAEKKTSSTTIRSVISSDDQQSMCSDRANNGAHMIKERTPRQKVEDLPRKVAIQFGEPGTSDMKVILLGKQGFSVKLSVHKNVLAENSSFFADKLSEIESGFSCLEMEDCKDVEIYVEAIGLMYGEDMKQRLIKQTVSRVLRILKVAEHLGFNACIQSCLNHLEAVPWIGEEEEEKVVNSVLKLKNDGVGITTILKRVASNSLDAPKETLTHIIELVLTSNEEKGRREMKSIVLKLLGEQSCSSSADSFNETIYSSCNNCFDSLRKQFRQAVDSESNMESALKQIGVESDNLSWLFDILAQRQAAEDFAETWANQKELAFLHEKLPVMSRCHVSKITSRLFVGIGRGELLPSKDTRLSLLRTWLQPLIDDYNWLQHGCRSFDCKLVEEGLGRTILTLPLEDQQSMLLSWLGNFLKAGDKCPNLQRAFEVWWRRSFVRPYTDSQGNNLLQTDCSKTSTSNE